MKDEKKKKKKKKGTTAVKIRVVRIHVRVGQTRDYLNCYRAFGRYNFFDILAPIANGTQAAKRPPTEGWQTSTSSPQNSFIRERRGTSDLEETAPFRMHNTF